MGNNNVTTAEPNTEPTNGGRPIFLQTQTINYRHTCNCKQPTKNDTTQQMILFDFSRAVGNIERVIIWAKLYESGIPIKFAQILRIGHEGNTLRPKCEGYIGNAGKTTKEYSTVSR